MSIVLAIANCRVSSDEQLLNNSLNRQKQSVLAAANELDVSIPADGWWSGSVSSKRGGNLQRKDIKEMLDYCTANKRVKYLIIDEPDRFMRSIDEAIYLEMEFKIRGVKVWYASDKDLNSDDMTAKLMKFMKYFVAEGSNEERQKKSINGQVQALKEGRYPFAPKPGYRKGKIDGVQEPHETKAPILKDFLIRIANHLITPTEALKELNAGDFMNNRAPYKMDKFRKIITDPFYAGIVEINKQVKFRNENGVHEPLISKSQHQELLRIMENKPKNQDGPRKNGNPKFPLNTILFCDSCQKQDGINKFVGFEHSNGKTPKLYTRYRCRNKGCGKYVHADKVHADVTDIFRSNPMTEPALDDLKDALEITWKEQGNQSVQSIVRVRHKIKTLKISISNQIEAISDPDNKNLVEEIRNSIQLKKNELEQLDREIESLENQSTQDKSDFIDFSLDYVNDLAVHFFELPREKQLVCKQLVFPAGFWVNENKEVYTPEISELYRLATKKKDTAVSDNSRLVRVKRL